MSKYILSVDQSTQGTKALLFNKAGDLMFRSDCLHKQIINELGWVEHDPEEIYHNTIQVIKELVAKSGIDKSEIVGMGISNQRETAMVWDRKTGKPVYNAIVWQCARGKEICQEIEKAGYGKLIQTHTGLPLSPYFSAAKIAWILRNVEGAKNKNDAGQLCMGTIDSWLIYKLTDGREFKTDFSNASRTQMFHVSKLEWDNEVCKLFGINTVCLAKICDSDAMFGNTDFEGYLNAPIPIHGVLGDSHAALYGQGCLNRGMIKATYGTGSSVMMNVGEEPVFSEGGLVTSLAWKIGGTVNYVLEGNINYTGAVISWIVKDLNLVESEKMTEKLALLANAEDKTYLVPAFTGLGAPYWDSKATGSITGITRTTGKAELVKAALDCIAYQIMDLVQVMSKASQIPLGEFRVDGGPTKNNYLMQFQSDVIDSRVEVANMEELSGIGAAYAAGIAMNLFDATSVFARVQRKSFLPGMEETVRRAKQEGWKLAVQSVLTK